MTKLEILFNAVLNKARDVRIKNPNIDGQAFWQPIKNELGFLKSIASHWKSINKGLVQKIMSLPEYAKDGGIIETNHFLIQQVRIPATETPTVRKIVQIALNIGQMYGNPDLDLMESLGYSETGLDQLSSYITKDDIMALSKQIPDETVKNVLDYLVSVESDTSDTSDTSSTVNLATHADLESIKALAEQYQQEVYGEIKERSLDEINTIALVNGVTYVYTEQQKVPKVLGFITIETERSPPDIIFRLIVVDRDHRNKGIGHILLRHTLDKYCVGNEKCVLTIEKQHPMQLYLIEYYSKYGFTVDAKRSNSSSVFMRYRLVT